MSDTQIIPGPPAPEAPQAPYVNRASGAAVGFIFGSVVVIALGLVARLCIPTTAIDADRAAERYKALAEIRAAEDTALSTPALTDSDRQIYRLPIDVAMQIIAQESQKDPASVRADLIARGQKATAALPKVAPKPSAFE